MEERGEVLTPVGFISSSCRSGRSKSLSPLSLAENWGKESRPSWCGLISDAVGMAKRGPFGTRREKKTSAAGWYQSTSLFSGHLFLLYSLFFPERASFLFFFFSLSLRLIVKLEHVSSPSGFISSSHLLKMFSIVFTLCPAVVWMAAINAPARTYTCTYQRGVCAVVSSLSLHWWQ